MPIVRLMHAKLHRVTVTEANRNYVGSVTIDRELLDRVGILPLEEVDIVNINNGNRWHTYVLPGDPGSGQICPNGGGAMLCQPGDLLIIWANEECDRVDVMLHGHEAKVLVADERNHEKEMFHQTLTPGKNGLNYDGHKRFNDQIFDSSLMVGV